MSMGLFEYAKKHPTKEPTDLERKIMNLEAQLIEVDSDDPRWMQRHDEQHNEKILQEIRLLEEGKT